MSVTETTQTSWFARLRNGVIGIFVGLILVVAMIWLLSWNEGRSVQTYRALVEGAGMVVTVASAPVDPAHEGKLVHLTGQVTPEGLPRDPAFTVTAQGAIALSRSVEMYQWVENKRSETTKSLGGGEETVTTYSYAREWRDRRIDSSDFHQSAQHENPDMPVSSETFPVDAVRIGAFSIDGGKMTGLGRGSPVKLAAETIGNVEAIIGDGRIVRADGATILVSANRDATTVGDLRIRFEREDLQSASLVGAQTGSSLGDFVTSNGRTIFLRASGTVSAPAMFDAAQSENTIITWALRIGGLIGLFVGFRLMLGLLGIIADIIPFLGSIVGFGTSLIALVLSLVLGPLVIAVAWFAYRPLLSLAVLAIGAALAAGIVYLRRGRVPASVPI